MHDNKTVVLDVVRPWPTVSPLYKSSGERWSFRYPWARWWKPWEGWTRFWRVAGRTLYWPALITIWHVEPNNRDTRPFPCATKRWRWHVHHWRPKVIPLLKLKRALFSRCYYCAGRFSYGYSPMATWSGEGPQWFRNGERVWHHYCYGTEREAVA